MQMPKLRLMFYRLSMSLYRTWAVTLTREPLSLPLTLSSFPSVTSNLRSHSFPSITPCPVPCFLSHLACPLRFTLCPVGRRRRPTHGTLVGQGLPVESRTSAYASSRISRMLGSGGVGSIGGVLTGGLPDAAVAVSTASVVSVV